MKMKNKTFAHFYIEIFVPIRSRGNVELKDTEDVVIETVDKIHTLTLKNVKPGDAALYSCKAHNPAGQTTCSARLKVARKYQITSFDTNWFVQKRLKHLNWLNGELAKC